MSSQEKFCSACGSGVAVQDVDGKPRPVCVRCRKVVYHDPKVAAICVVERGGQVLMIRRDTPVGRGLWSMPGGFIDRGEVVEEGAAREVSEETGLRVEIESMIGLFSEAGNPVVVAAYAARETGGSLEAGPEAQQVGFFPLDALPPLAFPRDKLILEMWHGSAANGAAGAPDASGANDVPGAAGATDAPDAAGANGVPGAAGANDAPDAAGANGVPGVAGSNVAPDAAGANGAPDAAGRPRGP